MRIIFVTHRYPPHTGGVETHVQEIATRLADRGHDVTVFSADAGSDVPSEHTDDGVQVRRFHSVSPGGAFYVAPQMALAVRQVDVDVVHVHNYHAFPLVFAALGVTDERFVVTTHYHGESANEFRNVLLSFYRPFGQWAVRQADEVIAVSKWEQERLREDFGVDATIIPNGVDVEWFENAEPEERERPYLLCVGRLEEYKGVQHVIRALPDLPEYDLVVAGSGPFREELERIAREEGVAERVDFLGYAGDERLPALYAGADVYVTMSEFEAYGMTVAEALVAGTPCMVREEGALQDWNKFEAVVSIKTVTRKGIASALLEVQDQSTVSTEVPDWDDVTSRLEKVYND